jgi:hypothetical protein
MRQRDVNEPQKAWVKPVLRRLTGGSAESNSGPGADGSGNAS